jgi:hypothetical protein
MKTKIVFGVLGFFLTLLFISCASAPLPTVAPSQPQPPLEPVDEPIREVQARQGASETSVPRPQSAIPNFLKIQLNGDSSGFIITNTDSKDHLVRIDFLTDRGNVRKMGYLVEANDIVHWSERTLLIRRIVLIDWT